MTSSTSRSLVLSSCGSRTHGYRIIPEGTLSEGEYVVGDLEEHL